MRGPGVWCLEDSTTGDSIRTKIPMLEAMPLVDVQHFVKTVCRKRSYAPTLALTQVEWGQKVSLGAQPTFFGINLRIMWTY